MKDVTIGLCGWNGSQGSYFENFRSIEIQTTFYDLPKLGVVERWKQNAPPGFRFFLKAWQLITHAPSSPTYRRLRQPLPDSAKPRLGLFQPTEEVMKAWDRTAEIARALEAEVVLFQCPKSFLPTGTNLSNLSKFFKSIERGSSFRLAWEPRGEQWEEDVIRELCQELDLIHCVDPFANRSVTTNPRYWRLHGIGAYSYQYTDADLLWLKRSLRNEFGPTMVMFNNFSSKADAIRFEKLIGVRD
jgi:uncharacterized protein YecE (DUF72 family)